jgi:hypothetical protein
MTPLTLAIECETIIVSVTSGILFSSNPPGADIYVIATGNGIPDGMPVYTELQTPNTMYLPAGSYDYILKLSGYEDYIGTTVVNPNEITSVSISLTLKAPMPIPAPVPISTPVLIVVGSISILGIILIATTKETVTITTGMLNDKNVAAKLK